jgi:hypothetical protein
MVVFVSRGSSTRKLIHNGSRRHVAPFVSMNRLQSTSTMDLVSIDEKGSRNALIYSTLQFPSGERDFSAKSRRHTKGNEQLWISLLKIAAENLAEQRSIVHRFVSEELDMIQAAERRDMYDKIILLVNNGEHVSNTHMNAVSKKGRIIDEDSIDTLTGKGVGQALSLSRRTAMFCNEETGLVPDLFVIEPSVKAAQTAFLSFPYDTPYSSLSGTRWICHPAAAGVHVDHAGISNLNLETLGVDCSILNSELPYMVPSSSNLYDNAMNLITWICEREEKVVVGKILLVLS